MICAIVQGENVSFISDPIPIKSPPEVTKVMCLLIYPIIKEGGCSGAWNFFACHCENGSSQIKVIGFDHY